MMFSQEEIKELHRQGPDAVFNFFEVLGEEIVDLRTQVYELRKQLNQVYFIFRPKIMAWGKYELHAELQGGRPDWPEYEPHWWNAQPLVRPLPRFTFAINPRAPKLDNYWTGTEFDLYSRRLISILHQAGVKFETFPVTMIDHQTQEVLPVRYQIFHLLEQYAGVDIEQSDIDGPSIRKLVLNKRCLEEKPLLFRDEKQTDLVFIHQDLKVVLEKARITGCQFIPVEKFQVVLEWWSTFKKRLPG
jgi:hypothetical protein